MNIQPLLAPCKGTLADLVISADPANPDQLQLYWGTALLMVIPRDRDSLIFRMTAGLLASLKLNMTSLEDCLEVTGKTLRKWRDALLDGDWEPLSPVFHGPGAEAKMRPDVDRYARRRYRDEIEKHGKTPHGFRRELISELKHFWGVDVSGETLRRVFRDEDIRSECVSPAPDPEVLPGTGAETMPDLDEENPRLASDENEEDEGIGMNAETVPAGRNREEGCAFSSFLSEDEEQTRNLPPENAATRFPEGCCGLDGAGGATTPPLFRPNAELHAEISQHAGLLLFSPWFEDAFANAQPIIRQTAAQILLGAVNQEQSKHIDYNGLGLLTRPLVRDIDHQHTRLKDAMDESTLMDVFARNAKLLNLENERTFLVDPHHKEYTGIENVLHAWSGKHHDTRKGILLDFIHTPDGAPCFVGHFDNFYDARDRFRLLVGRFRTLFGEDASGFTWIHDRGYWGRWFLEWIAGSGDFFIQWEKGYNSDGWEQPFRSSGKFTLVRTRNNSSDRVRIRVDWREQAWPDIAGGRRLIIRLRRRDGDSLEAAIVTNQPEFSARKVIELMLSRWLQETDFTYLARHFGIDELGGRLFEEYARIAPTLEDRQVQSRGHRAASNRRAKLRDKLGNKLFKLNNMPAVSLEQLEEQRETLRAEVVAIAGDLERLKAGPSVPDRQIRRLGDQVAELKRKLTRNRKDRHAAEQRADIEAQKATLEQSLAEVERHLAGISRTESRLLALIEEKTVRPDLRKKAVLDAIRITSRNVFRQPFDIFRSIYNNHRDDHDVLRQLSRSSGVVIRHPHRVDIYLTPALQRQPAQWRRIEEFIAVCEQRIQQKFGVTVRFLVNKTQKQIIAAIMRAQFDQDAS